MSDPWPVNSVRNDSLSGNPHSRHPSPAARHSPAFTLIEIMIVVAIIGLIAAMGVPSIFQVFRKEGMRQAVSDVQQLLADARAKAIYSGTITEVVFHPREKRIEPSYTLPDNVDIAMLEINMFDFGGSDVARVHFYPNGTCDELVLVLHCRDEWEKITLEFSTSLSTVGPVTQ